MSNDIIKRLPDSVANQIAAGEVIQNPASVVKELVENSIDAGARSVEIIIKDAGRTLIQVIDDGKGMSPIDARMAFERHATSKIDTFDDMTTLTTMGFRGEALPSVASVAEVELRTRTTDDTIGSRIFINNARFERQEPFAAQKGTNIMVKNLFFHLPARRKYLKKDSVELSRILREFEKLALVNPDVEFKISHNGTLLHQLQAGSMKMRIESLFGRAVGGQLIPVGTETSIVKISGFVGAPSHARKRGAPQFFFVNGRNMRHPYFHKAVMNCYEELIAPDTLPAYFINFEVDPSTIDVNVHPQKFEIKFENEQEVWQILTAAIKQSLGRANAAGALDFNAPDTGAIEVPVFAPNSDTPMPGIETVESYNPFNDTSDAPGFERRVERRSNIGGGFASRPQKDWDKLYESFTTRRDDTADTTPPENNTDTASNEVRSTLFENKESHAFLTLDNRYIVATSRSGLLLIHRRRAHIRVLYDQFMERMAQAPLQSQRLIFPETVELSPSQSAALSAMSDTLLHLGFDVSFLGDNVWAINASPAISANFSPTDTLARIAADLSDDGSTSGDTLLHPAALALARSAAFNHTSELSNADTDALIGQLMSSSDPSFTPDGLTIIHPIDLSEIQRLFN